MTCEQLNVFPDLGGPSHRRYYSAAVVCPIADSCSDKDCECRKPHRKHWTCNRDRRSLCPTCTASGIPGLRPRKKYDVTNRIEIK